MKLTKLILFLNLSLLSLQCFAWGPSASGSVYCAHGATIEEAAQDLNAQLSRTNDSIISAPTISLADGLATHSANLLICVSANPK